MDERIELQEGITVINPYLLAGWPGMGKVAVCAARHLIRQFEMKAVGRIRADRFFRIAGVAVKAGVIAPVASPESVFYHAPGVCDGGDLLVFLGDDQPVPGQEYALAQAVIDVAQRFHARRVYTTAAMVTSTNHKTAPKVWGVATDEALTAELLDLDVTLLNEGQIGGLNGLLLGAALERGIEGVCLLGEVPYYVTELMNPRAARVCLEVFGKMTGLAVSYDELDQASGILEERIDVTLRQLRASQESEEGENLPLTGESEGGGSGPSGPIN